MRVSAWKKPEAKHNAPRVSATNWRIGSMGRGFLSEGPASRAFGTPMLGLTRVPLLNNGAPNTPCRQFPRFKEGWSLFDSLETNQDHSHCTTPRRFAHF